MKKFENKCVKKSSACCFFVDNVVIVILFQYICYLYVGA